MSNIEDDTLFRRKDHACPLYPRGRGKGGQKPSSLHPLFAAEVQPTLGNRLNRRVERSTGSGAHSRNGLARSSSGFFAAVHATRLRGAHATIPSSRSAVYLRADVGERESGIPRLQVQHPLFVAQYTGRPSGLWGRGGGETERTQLG